jgi:putative membrane protein
MNFFGTILLASHEMITIMTTIYKLVALIVVAVTVSCHEARKDDSNTLAEQANDQKFQTNEAKEDANFIAKAVADTYAEMALAKLAVQRSANEEVKEIAYGLERDYQKLLSELKTLAEHKAISLPSEDKNEDFNKSKKFQNKTAKDFDRKWCSEMIDAYEDMITQFEKRMERSKDPDIKALANKILPNLRTQLEKLHACCDKLK